MMALKLRRLGSSRSEQSAMKTAATISGEIIRGSVSSGLSCVEFPNMETAHEF
jgi:hypothetical protein